MSQETGETGIMLKPEQRMHVSGTQRCIECCKIVNDTIGECCGVVCWSKLYNEPYGSKEYEQARQLFAKIQDMRQQQQAERFQVEPSHLPEKVNVEVKQGRIELLGCPGKYEESNNLSGDPRRFKEPGKKAIETLSNEQKQVLAEGGMQFESGAVRSSDKAHVAWHLMSPTALRRLAAVYHRGGLKYGQYNWEKGFPIGDLLNHALDHIITYLERTVDGVNEEDDLAHAAWNLLAAMHMEKHHTELNHDLRPNHPVTLRSENKWIL